MFSGNFINLIERILPMKQLFLILLAASSIVVSSCKKDNADDSQARATEQKILGKWQINNISINDNFSGEDHIVIHPGTSSEYVDFKSDGKMHTYFRGRLNISEYRVVDAKTITIDQDDASIRKLTDSTLVFSSRDATGSIGFTEVIYDLKR
jgi:hypothetical protein